MRSWDSMRSPAKSPDTCIAQPLRSPLFATSGPVSPHPIAPHPIGVSLGYGDKLKSWRFCSSTEQNPVQGAMLTRASLLRGDPLSPLSRQEMLGLLALPSSLKPILGGHSPSAGHRKASPISALELVVENFLGTPILDSVIPCGIHVIEKALERLP